MTQTIDLKALEKKAWRSVFQDGLWDIYLGILLMAFAVGAWLDRQPISENMRVGIYIGVQILAMIILFAGKRFVTMPRMGRVKFGAERQKRHNRRSASRRCSRSDRTASARCCPAFARSTSISAPHRSRATCRS